MNLHYNPAPPLIMHIDLNSCFATVEQQARPMLRGRPVAIMNRRSPHTMIVTCSYEAKARGVKLGMRFRDAKKLCPSLVGLESDPPKYHYVYHKLMAIMSDYSAHVRMKSIDEGVIDFSESTASLKGRNMMDIGQEIKQRLTSEIGCAMRCNVGISTNRFLAKTAAGLNKPDGLNEIRSHNIQEVFSRLELTDLTGIAGRMERRLNAVGIYTPLQLLDASPVTLEKMVYKSICGLEWHQRLRGWEVDKRDFPLRSAGRQYVLERFDLTHGQILQRLHHLCESVGQKIRTQDKQARGVAVYARSRSIGYWHARHMASLPFFSNQAIYAIASQLFDTAPEDIKEIGVTCYELSDAGDTQLSLFGDELARTHRVVDVIDDINHRYGDRTIHSANTLDTGIYMKQKIPFGSTRYL